MTRKTRIYKVTIAKKTIRYRTLTIEELGIINNLKKAINKVELAAELGAIDDIKDISWTDKLILGNRVISRSNRFDTEIAMELQIKKARDELLKDTWLILIIEICKRLPTISLTDLIKMTPEDIISVAVMVESITGQTILGQKKQMKKKLPTSRITNTFDDNGKTLAQKLAELKK